jgi:AraC-like DNA-binding protein
VLTMRYMPPCADLSGRITSYYVMEGSGSAPLDLHDFLIPEWPNLRCLLGGHATLTLKEKRSYNAPVGVLFGTTDMAMKVYLSGPFKLVGAGFFPRGWRDLVGASADAWLNRMDGIEQAWGHDPTTVWTALGSAATDADIARLLDQLFLQRLRALAAPKIAPSVEVVEHLLVDPDVSSVDMIVERTGLSLRQIERISRRSYGQSPKQVIRKFRFLRTVATLAKTPDAAWRDLIDVLYYDQSHFIRDFKQFTGITPTEYQKKPPLLVKGFLRSLGSAISLRTLPAHFELDASNPKAPAHTGRPTLKIA